LASRGDHSAAGGAGVLPHTPTVRVIDQSSSRCPKGDPRSTHQVGGRTVLEYWTPANDLGELNANLVGPIEVVAEHR